MKAMTKTSRKAKRSYRSRTPADWQAIVDAYHSTDLTQKIFCENHGITLSGLHLWRKRLATPVKKDNPGHFVEIIAPDTPAAMTQTIDRHWDVELALGPHCLLRIKAA